jgi:hypothetical protein
MRRKYVRRPWIGNAGQRSRASHGQYVPSRSVSTRGGLLLLLGLPHGDRGECGPRQGAKKALVTQRRH